jgi:hypothetical protein
LRTPIIPRAPLLADAGRQAFSLLDGHLLDERLRLVVQVPRLGVEGAGMACSSVAAAMSFWLARGGLSDVEVGVDAIAGLSAQLTRAFATRRSFPCDRGAKQLHRAVLFRQLVLELACLGQLCVDVGPLGGEGGGALGPAARRDPVPRAGGISPSPEPTTSVAFAGSLAMTTQHSRVGS